ncbi:alpha/beta fold hydrolase [Bradyrhizobium sp.]|uniref:alpha/beta fold hydrolase n=1 Tax=Bradyrhizobium sp. TaxID=376 RepID=UPI0025C047D2|nr:alpha/beta fold hydrolase [Bradyrhizobium sp.]MBV8921656.1 alpha/beta fold hydrolase [Bradyrhizobium sp.]
MVWFPLKLTQWVLGLVGAVALLLTAMVARPVSQPPELVSISNTARAVDRSTMPGLERFHGRDGTELAYRHYPARGQATGQIAILVHGSSGSSVAIHALSDAIAARGVDTYAPDIRGHGGSGSRGDVAYLGQLEDDMADFVAEIRKTNPTAPITLLGHSAGGGFALRIAASPIQNLFVRTVLLAPYLGHDALTNRPDSGGWASADLPRLFGLAILHRLGVDCCQSLPTLAFAVPANSSAILNPTYSYRLMRNFATSGYRRDLEAATRPVALFAGADDELMIADKYRDAVGEHVPVHLIDGVNHMAIVSDSRAVAAIADDVVSHGVTGS